MSENKIPMIRVNGVYYNVMNFSRVIRQNFREEPDYKYVPPCKKRVLFFFTEQVDGYFLNSDGKRLSMWNPIIWNLEGRKDGSVYRSARVKVAIGDKNITFDFGEDQTALEKFFDDLSRVTEVYSDLNIEGIY
jgi:hypothetical protein